MAVSQPSQSAQIYAFAAAAFVVLSCWLAVALNYAPVPHWDTWALIGFRTSWEGADLPQKLGLLIDNHNEHRILYTRSLFLLDETVGGARFYLLHLFNGLIPLLPLGLIFWVVRGLPAGERVLIMAGAAALLFSLSQRENFYWEFQSQFFLAQFVPMAFYCLLCMSVGRSMLRSIIVLLLGSVLSMFTMANGLLFALPVVILFAFARQLWPLAGAALATTVVVFWVYFSLLPYAEPGGHGAPIDNLMQDPLGYVVYVLTYMAGFMNDVTAATIVGGLFALATVFAVLTERRRLHDLDLATALLLTVGYIWLSAGVTGLGRVIFGAEQALSGRYFTPVSLAWICLALWYWLRFRSRLTSARILKNTSCTVVTVAALFNLVAVVQIDSADRAEQHLGLLGLQLGMAAPDDTKRLYPRHDSLKDVEKAAREAGIPQFRDTDWRRLARRVGTEAQTASDTLCNARLVGGIEPRPGGASVSGWVDGGPFWSVRPESVSLVHEGQILGVGYVGLDRVFGARAPEGFPKEGGFRVFVPALADLPNGTRLVVHDRCIASIS